MDLRFTYPILFCTLILMNYGGVDAAKNLQEKSSSSSSVYNHKHQSNGTDAEKKTESAQIGLFTMDELLSFRVGTKLPIFFPIRNLSLYPPLFLPENFAKIIPFSTKEAAAVFDLFSVPPVSRRGEAFLGTLITCEESIEGENKICATSLESMIGFVEKAFGPEVDFEFVTTTHPTITTPIIQSYTVLEAPLEIRSAKKVACHPFPYFYAVYFCHSDPNYGTKAFKVRLVAESTGDEVEAVVVCHLDSKSLRSDHLVFRMLGIEKGGSFCHVFRQGDIVWIQKTSPLAAM
ncbi:unknown seed protein like 1 [Hibiscus trionum]|nr:unknown seed protein like 1 [Hibiscus trionum]